MSHTVTMEVSITDPDAFGAAAVALGGEALGVGSHRLFEGTERGYGVTLPGWSFPIVLTESGLRYDDYHGRWGDPADLGKLTERYTLERARGVCAEQGWYCEDAPDGTLTIYHPDGGTISVGPNGAVDAACFEGRDCQQATEPLEAALGRRLEVVEKPELLHEHANVQTLDGSGV